MATYLITGKLGSGKTLSTIDKIKKALNDGLKVATNLDLNLSELMPLSSRASVLRLPDFPTVEDMEALGYGSAVPDENKFGLIVLDEVAVWLNARSWNDQGRKEFIDWLLHSRKYGWHVFLIIQNAALLDKQIRSSVVEFVVECPHLDRLGIPFLSSFSRLFGVKITLPKMHVGIVKYGTSHNAPVAERWFYKGDAYYKAYDTRQIFTADYPNGLHCLLPAWHTKGRYLTWWEMNKKQLFFALFFGFVVGALSGVYGGRHYEEIKKKNELVLNKEEKKADGLINKSEIQGYFFDSSGRAFVRFDDGRVIETVDYIYIDGEYVFNINNLKMKVKQ